ncbi:hypothetical protein BDW59DRAFT_155040 [Aspergillus cavernicola]|uniref:Uncharacterized protein n=1 Tax=Aspergillus cavernicola TaxID=176166 RepID=A0ABR4HDS8_9EURO
MGAACAESCASWLSLLPLGLRTPVCSEGKWSDSSSPYLLAPSIYVWIDNDTAINLE